MQNHSQILQAAFLGVKAMFTLPVTPEYRGHGGGWQYNKMRVLTTLRNQAETCNQD